MAQATNTKQTIGRLSENTGVNIETVRYYERIGLLPRPPRSAGGQRLFGKPEEQRLRFIRRSRELGFSIDDVRTMLRLVDGGRFTCAQVRGLALEHLADIRHKIADLRRLERVLADLAARCTGHAVPECPLIETLSQER
jgi:MerR family mercuric resistance operon transcriptional regulator